MSEEALKEEIEETAEVTDEEELQEEVQGEEQVSDEVTITIGEEQEHEQAPDWVKELRRKNREDKKRIRELEEQLNATKAPTKVGQKPKLEDFDYDTDRFEQELERWYEKKRQADAEAAAVEREKAQQEESWKRTLDDYQEKKAALKVKDFDEAEETVKDILSVTQQGIILQGAENSAKVILELGNNPNLASKLAQISDPVKFSFAIANLETKLKSPAKRTPPSPESKVTGTAPVSGAVDSTLERLRKEAAKTGDYSKVAEYKRNNRNK